MSAPRRSSVHARPPSAALRFAGRNQRLGIRTGPGVSVSTSSSSISVTCVKHSGSAKRVRPRQPSTLPRPTQFWSCPWGTRGSGAPPALLGEAPSPRRPASRAHAGVAGSRKHAAAWNSHFPPGCKRSFAFPPEMYVSTRGSPRWAALAEDSPCQA